MYKLLIVILFFSAIGTMDCRAQQSFTFPSSDSITYQCYLRGDWENLILAGKESIKQQVDFKWLRQRLGYAYFVKGDYYASQQQYEKALAFDRTDTLTLTYLYYCGLYTNNPSFARFQLSKLPVSIRKQLETKSRRILDALDVEYNYKMNDNAINSNPAYYKLGVNSKPGYRLSIYQAFSHYSQRVDSAGIKQNEYFVQAEWLLTSHISLNIAYHYMATNVVDTSTYRVNRRKTSTVIDSTFLPGHLFYTKLSFRQDRFDLAINASILSYNSVLTQQYGIQAGYILPGKSNIYLKSSIYDLVAPGINRFIFSQSVGAPLFKSLWGEGNITLGNLMNFSESNGMYIYNSDDATTFRAGLSLFWNVTKKLTVFGNYSYNRKQTVNTGKPDINYNQHSISSGIIWKI